MSSTASPPRRTPKESYHQVEVRDATPAEEQEIAAAWAAFKLRKLSNSNKKLVVTWDRYSKSGVVADAVRCKNCKADDKTEEVEVEVPPAKGKGKKNQQPTTESRPKLQSCVVRLDEKGNIVSRCQNCCINHGGCSLSTVGFDEFGNKKPNKRGKIDVTPKIHGQMDKALKDLQGSVRLFALQVKGEFEKSTPKGSLKLVSDFENDVVGPLVTLKKIVRDAHVRTAKVPAKAGTSGGKKRTFDELEEEEDEDEEVVEE